MVKEKNDKIEKFQRLYNKNQLFFHIGKNTVSTSFKNGLPVLV